ncbi:MAG: hypothetical protein KAQ62_09880, partial [Cyclobacteriaceae bacterium]|nr:hypothetical protein [Cyclobacteriaceae bacterium]
MSYIYKTILILSLLFLRTTILFGQELIFDNFQVEDGLSQSSVLAITQDAEGFMWFGTVDGLNRFDSRKFKIYKSEAHDSSSLSNSRVNCLFVDIENRLWVGTADGLNVYNSDKDNFSRVFLQGNASQGSFGIQTAVYEIIQDRLGDIWITSDQGLFRLNTDSELSPEKILVLAQNNKEIIEFRGLYEDRHGSIWAGTNGGIVKLVIEGNIVNQSSISLIGKDGSINVGFAVDIDELSNGNICIATENSGVFLYDIESASMRNISHEIDGNGLLSNIVKSILIDSLENLWLGTRNGLSIYNSEGEFIKNYWKDYSKKGSLSDNSIRSLYEDKNGSIWIGTFFGGINLQSKAFFPISTYTFNETGFGLNSEVISAVYESNSGKLFIGTEGGGLNILDRSLNKYETLKNEYGNVASLSLNNVKCIYQDSEGLYWIGTSGGGVNVYNREANSIKRILHEGNDQKSDRENWIYSIVEDDKGKVWFGTFGAGLNYYDRVRDKVFDVSGPIGNTPDFRFIRTLYIDSKDRLWIGSEAGLFLYHSESNTITSYNKSTSPMLPQSTNGILCIYEDQHHLLWVGTSGEGLLKYDIKKDSFAIYNVGDGLSGDRILGILEDIENQVLWISTNNGISKFDPKALSFRNFTKEDGLLDLEFNANAYFKSNSGEMFFGGRNGLISFYPHLINENTTIPPVVFTELKLFHKTIRVNDESGILDKQLSKKESITLEHDQNFITIDFAVLNFIKSAKNKYAYKLVGIDENWNYVNVPTATFTNLNPGSYSLMVKGCNNDGYWNSSKIELSIIVKPALWKTWWANSIYLTIIFTSIFILVRDQRIKAKLEHELKLEQLNLQQEENVHQLKMKFFTNISHEIRTPLTLVLTPIDKLIAEYRSDPYLFKNLIGIKNHADRLLRLVNQLLDFRRQEVGEIKL